jgi:serine/threonine protein kinase
MSQTEAHHSASAVPNGDGSAPDDSQVLRAVEEYLAILETGQTPSRDEFLARHAAIAARLVEYLDGLELIHRAGSAAGPMTEGDAPANDLAGAEPLGDFLLLREIGRGGMGVVYEALQRSLNRKVALKVLPFAAALDARHLQRFKNEAQAAACLHHPHIVPVFGVGCERGVHYYAMQLIDGQTLATLIAGLRETGGWPVFLEVQPTTLVPEADTSSRTLASTERAPLDRAHFRRVAVLGIQAAEALDHAHALGIVHRDIKPGNLMVDDRGGVWVTDFGLAYIQSDARLTMTGDLVGTLRYMSPEQALARRVVDHRADIYSLGATLYELLTLEPAFRGNDRQELLRQIAFEEPTPPRRLNRAVPAELETIVVKAMEKNPAERYATTKELADDLRRFLADEPIRARPAGLVRRLRRWIKRHPALATALVLLLAFGAIALAYRQRPPTPAELEQSAEKEYRKAIAHLEKELSQGGSISLVGPETGALAHRWRAGQGHVGVPENSQQGGVVTISAQRPSLLELLHDTGSPSYRLVVEMRQEKRVRLSDNAEVGVSFAYSKYVTEEGPQFIFGRVRFADIGSGAAVWKDKAGRPASLFQIDLYLLGATRSGIDRARPFGGPSVFYPPVPAGALPAPWRRIEVEVRPGKFRAKHWDGAVKEMLTGTEVPIALTIFRKRYPGFQNIQYPLAIQNSVGLFLEDSVVSLRRFDVEPLPEGD